MAFEECTCIGEGGNTAWTSCQPLFGSASGFAFSRNVNKDGIRKSYNITTAATFGTSFIDDFTAEASSRLFPVANLRNSDFPQEDTAYKTDNEGQKEFLREGVISYTGEKWQAGAVYADKINSHRCKDNGVFVATDKGMYGVRVHNNDTNTDTWYPIPVTALNAQWKPKKPGTDNEFVMVSFDFSNRLNVGQLWLVTWDELGMTPDEFTYEGLLDVNFTLVNAPVAALGVTTVGYKLTTDYGSGVGEGQNVDGKLISNFSIVNKTTGLPATGAALTEIDGVKYTFTYDQETPTEIIKISLVTSGTNKFEGSATPYAEPA